MKSLKQLKKGSLAITIVMLVFCLLMSVSMSYHKMLQTETKIHKQNDNSERALDAAFSGVNYTISFIQSKKEVFTNKKGQVTTQITNTKIPNKWYCLSNDMKFTDYYDEKEDFIPPYRFKTQYYHNDNDNFLLIKSIGEYIQYSGTTKVGSYTAQLIARCIINNANNTINIQKYRKMNVNESKLGDFSQGYNEP